MLKSPAYIAGFIVGILTVVIISILVSYILKKKNKDKKYDERQEAIRGKSYTTGFITFVIAQVLSMAFYSFLNTPTVDKSVVIFINFLTLYIGALGCIIHAIWHDAYFRIGERKKAWLIGLLAVAILEFILGISLLSETKEPGAVPGAWNNFAIAIFLFIIFCNACLKIIIDRKKTLNEGDEE